MTKAFRRRRDFVIGALGNMPGIKINDPKGAFYAFPNVSAFFGTSDGKTNIQNDEDFSMYLLHTAHITTVNGGAFGNARCIRLSFATDMETLHKAMDRMRDAVARLH